jgi:hypothetical protein
MDRVDITADLNDEDETGYVLTFLDEARDPAQIKPGAIIVAGDQDAVVRATRGWHPPDSGINELALQRVRCQPFGTDVTIYLGARLIGQAT